MGLGGRKRFASLVAGSFLFLSAFLHPCAAEEKTFDVKFKRQTYNVRLDESKQAYYVFPDADYATRREVLASAIIESLVQQIENRKNTLEEKLEEFLYSNPSHMHLKTYYKDVDFKIAHESPFNIDSPILDIVAERKGKELSCEIKLSSYESVMLWDKRASVVISYPEDTSIIRRPDKAHEIYVDSKDIYGRYRTREVPFCDEREVIGIGIELLEERLKQTLEEGYGIKGRLFFSPIEGEEWLEKNERTRREKKTKSMVRDRNWRQYQPRGEMQSPFEVGRTFSLKFEGKPERIDFFINSSLYQNPLNPSKKATTLNNESIMLKLISVFIDEPTDKTTAGRLVKLGRTIEEESEELIDEYKKKRLQNIKEKEGFYHRLKFRGSEVFPFITLLEAVKDKELVGNLDNIYDYERFRQNVSGIRKSVIPLKKLLIKYEEKRESNAKDTLSYFRILSEAIDRYRCRNKKYPETLEALARENYIPELKNDEWGNKILYKKRTSKDGDWAYELWSPGKDGKFSDNINYKTEDDIYLGKVSTP